MIVVERLNRKSAARSDVEIVERKGKGHPDYICDSVMEAVSIALSREYRATFGTILHHNIDKGLLAAGRARHAFGGGKMLKPMELIIGDRATFTAGGKKVPVADIAVQAARDWIRENLRFVDPDRHVRFRVVLSPVSEELSDIFSRQGNVLAANDTSALIGYYPMSPAEETVLALERFLNSKGFKKKYPETGEDVKVMGLRLRSSLDLTVAMPFLSPFISSEDEYFQRKELVTGEIRRFLQGRRGFDRMTVHFNTLDVPERGVRGVYLSLLGTSAEDADSGQVGRGNRVNGLISVNRPMGTEAAAGKNPVSHVGKIYNVLAHKMAEKIYKNVDGIEEVYVALLSRIGRPIDSPNVASAQLSLKKGVGLRDVSGQVTAIIEQELSDIAAFCERLAEGAYSIC